MNKYENLLLEIKQHDVETVRKMCGLGNPERMKEALDILEDWIQKQNHFIKKKFDRGYLERVITTSKGSIEKAKKQLDRICTFRTLLPTFFLFDNIREDFKETFKIMSMVPLPKVTDKMERLYTGKLHQVDITPKIFINFCRYNILVCEYLKLKDYMNSYRIIYDFRGCNLIELVTKISVTDIHSILSIVIEGYGASITGLHFISTSKYGEAFVKILKQCVSTKIASRFHIHSKVEDIYDVIDKEFLPKDFGGSEKSIKELNENWLNVLCSEEYTAYVQEMKNARTDESKRLKDNFNDLYLGTAGTFRTITVD